MNGTKQNKKPTNAQLQRRLDKAVLHIDRTKDTKEVYFSDKGLRLIVDGDYAIIETGYHRNVFNAWTTSGVSRPYLYTKRFVDTALANLEEIKTENGYSYQRLFEVLNTKEDKTDYNLCTYTDWYFTLIFSNLYEIGETTAEQALLFESYCHTVARQQVILDEKNEEMTNKQFFKKVKAVESGFFDGIEETVIFEKMSDEELMKQNVKAVQLDEAENAVEAQQHE